MMWIVFSVTILGMLALDLGLMNRKAHEIKLKEAALWSAFWIGVALAFNLWVYFYKGPEAGASFFAAYLLEKTLSMDNLFVFLLIFGYFKVASRLQHKILFWGIIGAIVFRGIFILLGVVLIQKFEWIIYVFGAFLVYTGVKMAFKKDEEIHPEKNPLLNLANKFFRIERVYTGDRFFIVKNGLRYATPLFVVLLAIESMDIVFAVDSIPAVFGVTKDPFIVFSSNIFAILGLRALYFLLAGFMRNFEELHYGLSLILVLIGIKMLVSRFYHVPTGMVLIVMAVIILLSIVPSVVRKIKAKNGNYWNNRKNGKNGKNGNNGDNGLNIKIKK